MHRSPTILLFVFVGGVKLQHVYSTPNVDLSQVLIHANSVIHQCSSCEAWRQNDLSLLLNMSPTCTSTWQLPFAAIASRCQHALHTERASWLELPSTYPGALCHVESGVRPSQIFLCCSSTFCRVTTAHASEAATRTKDCSRPPAPCGNSNTNAFSDALSFCNRHRPPPM